MDRLTPEELGDEGNIDPHLSGRKVLIEVTIDTSFSSVISLKIGQHWVNVPNDALRQAAIEGTF